MRGEDLFGFGLKTLLYWWATTAYGTRHDLKYLGQKPKTNGWIGRWTFAGPFRRRFSTGMWQNAHINTVRHAMVCCVFFLFYDL